VYCTHSLPCYITTYQPFKWFSNVGIHDLGVWFSVSGIFETVVINGVICWRFRWCHYLTLPLEWISPVDDSQCSGHQVGLLRIPVKPRQ